MKTKDIIYNLRTQAGYSQEDLAQMIFVTRQAISIWENGETTPSIDAFRLLSQVFNVSIDELLGTDDVDGCCDQRMYLQDDLDKLNAFCLKYLGNEVFDEHTDRKVTKQDDLTRYKELAQEDAFNEFKLQLIQEINDLRIEGMPTLESIHPLIGSFVNVAYRLPNGNYVKFLENDVTYLGNELRCMYNDSMCFGIICNMEFILVCSYLTNGESVELITYIKR